MDYEITHQQIPLSGKTWCSSGVIMLLVLIFIVFVANVWAFNSGSGLATLLRPVALIFGILYCLGVPLALFLHGRAFVCIRWDPAGFVMSHYLTPWHPPEAATWSDIHHIVVKVGSIEFTDAQLALTALRKELDRNKFLSSFPVSIVFHCQSDRKISVLPAMLTPRQVKPFLSATAHYLSEK